MAKKNSAGKTIFKIACATGGAVLASGVGLPWLGAMAGSCLPKVLEGSLGFLVSAVDDDKKQEILAGLLQKPIEQLASLGIEFTGGRIDDFFKSHFAAKDAELNFDLPRAVLKVWEEALNKMLGAERDTSTLGLNRDDDFEKARKELLAFWRRKLLKAQSDNDLLKEFFGEKPNYFLDIEKGKSSFIDILPDQEQVEKFFWERLEESFTNWAENEEKFPEDWANSIRQNLKDELKQNLFHDFSSALKKELKENERAWKSFEFASSLQTVSMLQSLASNTDRIKDDTSNIKNDLAELNTVLPLIMRDILNRFDALENTVKEFFTSNQNINGLLIDFRKEVNEKLDRIENYSKQANEKLDKLLRQNLGEEFDLKWTYKKIDDSTLPKEVNEKIKEAKGASKLGKFELSKGIWEEIAETALETGNHELSIRTRLEIALVEVQDDLQNMDNALKIANDCLVESKKINLGNQVGRILQLLGEFHRLNRNTEKAKGFMKASLEFSKSRKDKNSEAWTLLSMAMLSKESNEPIETQLDYTRKAYEIFTSLEASGEKESIEQAYDGYATCHLQRAESYGHRRFDEAVAEYSLAIKIYREMGEPWEFQLARALFDRGEIQARNGDLRQGINDLLKASEIFKKLNNHYMEAKCELAGAELLDEMGFRVESEKGYRLALQKASQIPDERKKSWFYLRYGMKLLELGENDKAKELLRWLVSNETTTDSQKLDVLRILSDLAKATKNVEELKEYEEYSLSIIEVLIGEATSPNERLHLLYKKGHTLEGLEKYELALETFYRAIRLAESMSSKVRLVDCWNSIAKVYAEMENPKEERKAYEQVLKIVGDDESSPQLAGTLMMLAQMEMKESNFKEANELLDRSEKLCKKVMPFLMFVINDIRNRLKEAESKVTADSSH